MNVRIVLLCEDSQTESFVRRFLGHRRFRHRDIFTIPLPHGKQSGEQWVRTQFPKELKAIRTRQQAYLVVVIDADARTTADTKAWLDAECHTQKVTPRRRNDPVVIAVPKRNIETWFAFLKTGQEVDEQQQYPRLPRVRDCRPLADELFRMCQEEQLTTAAPPSLVAAYPEYRKLKR